MIRASHSAFVKYNYFMKEKLKVIFLGEIFIEMNVMKKSTILLELDFEKAFDTFK
jgi:hypothetical protein